MIEIFFAIIILFGSALAFSTPFIEKDDSLTSLFLKGWGALLVVLISLNFFLPINTKMSVTIFLFASGIALFQRKRAAQVLDSIRRSWPQERNGVLSLLFGFLVLFLVASISSALRPPTAYDTSLYHVPVALWSQREAVPLGQGWIHQRFGFHTGFFLPYSYISSLTNQLRLVAAPSLTIIAVFILFAFSESIHRKKLSLVLLLPFLFSLPYWPDFTTSLVPEFALFFFGLLSLYFAQKNNFSLSLLSASLAFSMKLSGIFLFAFPFLCFLQPAYRLKRKELLMSGAIIASTILRSLWTTGFLLYPVSLTRLPLPHALPQEWARAITSDIYRFARYNPYKEQITSHFLFVWDFFISLHPIFWVGICLILWSVFITFSMRLWKLLLIQLLAIAQFLISFVVAPDIRLVWPALLWCHYSALLALEEQYFSSLPSKIWERLILMLTFLSFGLFLQALSSPIKVFPVSRELITPTYPLAGIEWPVRTRREFPFSFTEADAAGICGFANPPCLLNATAAATLKYTMKGQSLRKIQPYE